MLVVIVGPTAVGKTAVSIEVARRLGGEVLTADSMQVYRLMNIGTAKPGVLERRGVPHHLIDLVYPDEPFSVAQYQKMALDKIDEVLSRGRMPLLSGGTGLYVKSVLDGYDFIPVAPDHDLRKELLGKEDTEEGSLYKWLREVDATAADKIHRNDLRRVVRALEVYMQTGRPISERWVKSQLPYRVEVFGLTAARDILYGWIEKRVHSQIQQGLIEEVSRLAEMGYTKELPSMQGLGYKEVFPFLESRATLDETIKLIMKNTRNFAKRQFTWFRRDSRIKWIDVGKINGAALAADQISASLEGTGTSSDE